MENKNTLTVSQAIHLANKAVGSIPLLSVVGEVSGFRGPNSRSGHCYFQIKDAVSTMEVIVWRDIYRNSDVHLEDGLKIQMTGSFDVYEASGKLSFKAKTLEVAGEGLLRQQVAALAKKLEAEGLMDSVRKRKIPAFCTRVAVVTSLSGSVIEDVRRTLQRRNPLVELLCAGCSVQGATAAPTIIQALQIAAQAQPDCILLVRGGGSYEDLMCFNDEALARAVAACPIPVITGIGHEPDVTICDMVSDRRTSTPTAAAESVAPAISEIVVAINNRQDRLANVMANMVISAKTTVDACVHRTTLAMQSRLSVEKTHLDALAKHRCLTDPSSIVDDRVNALLQTEQRLMDALPRVVEQRLRDVSHLSTRLTSVGARMTRPYVLALDRQAAFLQALSPLNVLSRGYAIVRTTSGSVVSDASQVSPNDNLTVMLNAGQLDVTVTKTQGKSSTE
ncbi:exodeoxyribonuclease VII large subunit [Atopobium fossor]|uniref:exodeoxyribonuclease VII large subunit n=1 Tax=Atopobium fossor TaxID=39487 RepID=UPI0005511810|nr:exodeoxyribonuclease VII large subunit [Atopobium fossor]